MKKTLMQLLLCLALLWGCTPQVDPSQTSQPPQLGESCDHKDADRDDYCDLCAGFVVVQRSIFAINDLHGKFQDSDSQPGVDELTTYLESQLEHTVLLGSGDIWQGSSESNLTYGHIMTEWMNDLDFAAMTLGNHEFDWGESYIESNQKLAEFPFLAINIFERDTHELVDYCQPSVLLERDGVTIGIIGAIGDCYSSISGDKTGDIYFQVGDALTELVKAESTRLREQGADVIIYVIHDGYDRNLSTGSTIASNQLASYYDTELSNGYVDLVFEGHTHRRYVFKDEYGVYHLQGGGENTGISHAEIFFNIATGEIRDIQAELVPSSIYEIHKPHENVATLLDKYQDLIAAGQEVLGRNSQFRDGDSLRQLVAQLYYEKAMERWGEQYDIVLGGGFISVRNPWCLEAGDVKYAQLQSLFPFDNQLVLCSVKGSSLKRNFFETGNENYFIYYGDYGKQVKENIDPNATYYILTDTYSSSYGPNQLTEVERYDAGVYARDLIAEYIEMGRMADSGIPTEYTLTPIPEILTLGEFLTPGATSEEYYFVKGTVISVSNSKYGNLTIADEGGNTLYVYGVYDATGSDRYDSMKNAPQVGDTVVLYAQVQHYVPPQGEAIIELYRARLVG